MIKKFEVKLMAIIFAALICFVSTPVLANSFGITSQIGSYPTSLSKGSTYTYSINLTFSSAIWESIPVPTECFIGGEFPVNVFTKTPTFVAGSSRFSFVLKSKGSVTRTKCWQCYNSYRVSGTATKKMTVKCVADGTKGVSGYANMGTGKVSGLVVLNSENITRTVKIAK